MTQLRDVAPHAMTGADYVKDAAKAIRPAQPSSLHNMSEGDLADEHRGQSFAKKRAAERLELIEAELQRRGVTEARGKQSAVKRHSNDGLIDFRQLRTDHPELVQRYVKPGSEHFFRSRTLTAQERP